MIALRRFGVLWVPLLAVGAGVAVFWLLPAVWAACSVSDWDPSRAAGVVVYAPLAGLAALVLCWSSYALLATRASSWVAAMAPIVSAGLALLVVWAVVAWQADKAGVLYDLCPHGVPPWWPSWVPL